MRVYPGRSDFTIGMEENADGKPSPAEHRPSVELYRRIEWDEEDMPVC
jgi:hypothetical protein